ncbi:MAG: MotA/TolQ/ExbB proton channel family protein [Cyanobacteria bacterium]|nr:MotA/TolQ/ExbB proton channel family protein [Synechococcus sp. BS307-5m-G38]MDA0257063.1 MotA/TolQ/ExbB proton channel family protein [Cyanobacteriota bacterium]
MFSPLALQQGGVLILPLLLLSIAVMSAGIDRLLHWIRWRRVCSGEIQQIRNGLHGLPSDAADRSLDRQLQRLDRRFRRWESSLDLAMALGPLLGLLATVLGLMGLLQALGPDLLLPRGEGLTVRYGQVLVGTALGLVIALMALVVQRLNRMQRRAELARIREACEAA